MGTFDAADDRLRRWIARHRRVFALTGAGCSTASGIPDYRDDQGEWKRRPPVMIQAFRTQDGGLPALLGARLRRMAALHDRRAQRRASRVRRLGSAPARCASSSRRTSTACTSAPAAAPSSTSTAVSTSSSASAAANAPAARDLQAAMAAANPHWQAAAATAPDGDADIDDAIVESFAAPRCERCGGLLKPDVVFFGENVPAERYAQAREALADADALLVAGSSLMVYSGFRFVRLAHEAGLPIAIVNRGRTRGDDLAELKIEGDVGSTLSDAVGALA